MWNVLPGKMEGKVAYQEKNSWPRREGYLRTSRGGTNQKAIVANIVEAIARVNNGHGEIVCESYENGVTRMKILVKKEHLKQVMIEAMRSNGESLCTARPSSCTSTLEQRLNAMRKRHLSRASQIAKRVGRQQTRSSWKPALHSIPEELF